MVAQEKIKLTKRSVDALRLKPPATGERIVWDADLRGFGVRLSSTGRCTYFIHTRTRARRQIKATIGVHGQVTADQARASAKSELGRIAGGADPVEVKRQARAAEVKRLRTLTVAQLCDKYLVEYAEMHNRPRSVAGNKAMIERIIKLRLGNIRVPDVERDEIAALHRDLKETPYVANRVLALLSKMLSLAVHAWKMRPDNPVVGIRRYDEEKRQRYLSAAELGRLAAALAEHPNRVAANAIRMLLLTGARRGEVLGMLWEQVKNEPGVWIKPSALTKQKTVHRIPLSPGARQLIADMERYRKPGEPHVFPGRAPGQPLVEIKKSWATICKAAGISGARIHDLRHTHGALLASSGYSLPIIGRLLGHTQASTTLRYAHLADDPLQAATDRIDALLSALAADRAAEVTPLRKR
jgi:integrase